MACFPKKKKIRYATIRRASKPKVSIISRFKCAEIHGKPLNL